MGTMNTENIDSDSSDVECCKYAAESDGSLVIQDIWVRDGDTLTQHRIEWMWDYILDRYNREHYTIEFSLDGDTVSHNGYSIEKNAENAMKGVLDSRPRLDEMYVGDIRETVENTDDFESVGDELNK